LDLHEIRYSGILYYTSERWVEDANGSDFYKSFLLLVK